MIKHILATQQMLVLPESSVSVDQPFTTKKSQYYIFKSNTNNTET